jgi:hypothetical protein
LLCSCLPLFIDLALLLHVQQLTKVSRHGRLALNSRKIRPNDCTRAQGDTCTKPAPFAPLSRALHSARAWHGDTCVLRVHTLRIDGARPRCVGLSCPLCCAVRSGGVQGKGETRRGQRREDGRTGSAVTAHTQTARESMQHRVCTTPCPTTLCSGPLRAADRRAREPHKCTGQLIAQAAQGMGDTGRHESRCKCIICSSCSKDCACAW